MAVDYYDYALAIDPTAGVVIPNATAQVYAVDDISFETPLSITDITGSVLAELKASPTGVFPPFRVTSGETQVMARTPAGVVTPLTSTFGSHGEAAEAAQAAAEASAAEAAASAAAAADSASQADNGLPPGGAIGEVLVKTGAEDRVVGWTSLGAGGLTLYSQVQALTGYPLSFPASPHTHPVSQLSDSSAIARQVMQAATATDIRNLIGAGTGNGTSNLTIGPLATQAAAGNHAHSAGSVQFAPSGVITASDVQTAIEQAAGTGGVTNDSVVIARDWDGTGTPARGAVGSLTVIRWRSPVAPTIDGVNVKNGDEWVSTV